MTAKCILITLILSLNLSLLAQEYNNHHKKYIQGGLNSGVYNGAYTGGVLGAFGSYFMTFNKLSAVDFRVKELYTVSPQREVGSITATYRLFLSSGFYIGAGFAHNHEINFKDYLNDPIPATIGNGKSIIHRTGLAAETGYDFKSLITKGKFGLYPTTNLCLAYMVLDKEPNPLITASFGLRFGFAKTEFIKQN